MNPVPPEDDVSIVVDQDLWTVIQTNPDLQRRFADEALADMASARKRKDAEVEIARLHAETDRIEAQSNADVRPLHMKFDLGLKIFGALIVPGILFLVFSNVGEGKLSGGDAVNIIVAICGLYAIVVGLNVYVGNKKKSV
jgi:hypothetical protein